MAVRIRYTTIAYTGPGAGIRRYQTLNHGERYQVKCIMVKPGGKLSLQSHHRSKHWVVVRGTLEVTKGEETVLFDETSTGAVRTNSAWPAHFLAEAAGNSNPRMAG